MSDENSMPESDMFGAEIVTSSDEENARKRSTYVDVTVERIVDMRVHQFNELASSLVAQDRDAADLLMRKLSEAITASMCIENHGVEA